MPDLSVAQKTLRVARIIHLALLFAAIAYVVIPVMVAPTVSQAPDPMFVLAFGLVALSALGAGLFIRARLMKPAAEKLAADPDDKAAAAQWQRGVVLSLVFCETVPIFGCLTRLIGAPWNVSAIFYAAGIFILLTWTPRLELSPS